MESRLFQQPVRSQARSHAFCESPSCPWLVLRPIRMATVAAPAKQTRISPSIVVRLRRPSPAWASRTVFSPQALPHPVTEGTLARLDRRVALTPAEDDRRDRVSGLVVGGDSEFLGNAR